jgi:hypothetical protein
LATTSSTLTEGAVSTNVARPLGKADENADHQKGEAMDSRLLAIANGFGERVGKVCKTR